MLPFNNWDQENSIFPFLLEIHSVESSFTKHQTTEEDFFPTLLHSVLVYVYAYRGLFWL